MEMDEITPIRGWNGNGTADIWRERSPAAMSSELLATYAGLGTYDGTQYYIGEECLGKIAYHGQPLDTSLPLGW